MGRTKKSINRKLSPAAVSTSSAPAPPWVELPGDVTANILQRLGVEEILYSAQIVCTTWRKVCLDPATWRVICMRDSENTEYDSDTMCRRAVDRSQGQLVDLTIDDFGDDELIGWIAERSPNLKRLALISCYDISGASLAQAVKKFPHLVELHLTILDDVLAKDVEAIGFSCPKLESFSYNRRGCKIGFLRDYEEFDEDGDGFDPNKYALAIGKSMPNLRHLQLFANEIEKEGLKAILEGCPHLDSLDVRQCSSIDREGIFDKCHEKIKNLKLPGDSIDDIVWLAGEPYERPPNYDSEESGWGGTDCGFERYGDYATYDDYTSRLCGYGYFNP